MTEERHPLGRTCAAPALLIVALFPIAVPALAARTWWLRRTARPGSESR